MHQDPRSPADDSSGSVRDRDAHLVALIDTARALAKESSDRDVEPGVLVISLALYESIAADRLAYLESLARARPGAESIGTWLELVAGGFAAAGALRSATARDPLLADRFARATGLLASTSTKALRRTLTAARGGLE